MTDYGFIILHRKIKETAIYSDSQAVHLWIHLLLKANHKSNQFVQNGKLITVNRGQLVTGRKKLSAETGVSESKIQRLLKLFEDMQMIEQLANSRNRLITVVNYDSHQSGEQQMNSPRTTDEQPANTNNNDNNDNNALVTSTSDDYEKPEIEKIPYQKIIDIYHEQCPELTRVMKLTETRKKQIKARWNDSDYDCKTSRFWTQFFTVVNQSDFLNGRVDGRGWKADFEWLTKLTNFVNVMEGKYV